MSITKTYKSRVLPVAVTVAFLAIACAVMPTSAHAADVLKDMIAKTGLQYDTIGEDLYIVPFETEDGDTLSVFVTYSNEEQKFVLIFCTVLDYEDEHQFKQETLATAMRINNDYPIIKMCLDADNGDIDCQVEPYVRTLDPEAL